MNVKGVINDEYWANVMQEELLQFGKKKVWELVPRSNFLNIVGMK